MKSPVTRRTFVKAGLAATAVAGLPGLAKAQPASPAPLWGALLHMGVNMWSDIPVDKYAVVRQGELWWHDFLFFVKEVEAQGVRPWIWSDYYWNHPEEFLNRMPKSVLQSNWYYGATFEPEKQKYVKTYLDLDKAGFEQVPTGSNWSSDVNFKGTVEFCKKSLAPERLKGFLMAPWFFTLPEWQEKNLQAIAQVEAMIKG